MGFWSGVGKFVRGTAKGVSKVVQFSGFVSGKLIEGGTYLAGEAVGLASDRMGDAIKGAGKTVSSVVQAPGRVVGTAIEASAGIVTGVASVIVGDDEGAEEAKNAFQDAVFGAQDDFEAAVETAKSTYESITAESEFKKAKIEFYDLQAQNEKQCKELGIARDEVNSRIVDDVKSINASKRRSAELFGRFSKAAAEISSWNIATYDAQDAFVCVSVKPAPIKSKNDVFADVNFDRDPIWNNLKGIATLGLVTSAQVEDARVAIANQRKAAEAKWADDKEDTRQLTLVETSLAFVRDSFDLFIDAYEKMISEVEYAIALMRNAQGMLDASFFSEGDKVNPYYLPKRHVLALMACDKLSRLLCEMSKRRYVTSGNAVIVSDEKLVRGYREEEFSRLQKEIAA